MDPACQAPDGLSILLIVLDGLADRPHPELAGRTPLEAARTPRLDALVAEGAAGFHYPLGPGRIPSSELVHFRFLGYGDFPFPGRACLEALGHGHPVRPGDTLSFLALRRVSVQPDGSFRVTARYGEGVEGAASVYRQLDGWTDPETGFRFTTHPLPAGEALLFIRPGKHDGPGAVTSTAGGELAPSGEITDSDPFFFTDLPVLNPLPLADARRPQAAARTAASLQRFLQAGARLLGADSAAPGDETRLIVSKWTGTLSELPSFERLTGLRGAVVASTPVYGGLAALLGLEYRSQPWDERDPERDLARKLAAAEACFEEGFDFVHVHTKAADEAGHGGDPHEKVAVIEALDRALAPLLETGRGRRVLCITADHATPVAGRTVHWGDSVPLLVTGPFIRRDRVTRFDERQATAGGLGQFTAADLLPFLLCQADRGHFQGARPLPEAVLGIPAGGGPFRIGPAGNR